MHIEFCRNFLRGQCQFGSCCRYLHDGTSPYSSTSQDQLFSTERRPYPGRRSPRPHDGDAHGHAPKRQKSSSRESGKLFKFSDRLWSNESTQAHQAKISGRLLGGSFRIMSYNILAESYALSYAPSLYPATPVGCLPWTLRLPLLLGEVDHWKPDVVCMQEVDVFDQLQVPMRRLGYVGVNVARTGDRSDGCATFWLQQRFRAVDVLPVQMNEYGLKDNVALLVMLAPVSALQGPSVPIVMNPTDNDVNGIATSTGQQVHEEEWAQHNYSDSRADNLISNGRRQHLRFDDDDQPSAALAVCQRDGVSATTEDMKQGPDTYQGYPESDLVDIGVDAGTEATSGPAHAVEKVLSSPYLLVANTHLLFNPNRGDIKLGQLRVILDRVEHLTRRTAGRTDSQVAVVFSGDFNSTPGSPLYDFLDQGSLHFASKDRRNLSGQVEGYGYRQYFHDLRRGVPTLVPYTKYGAAANAPSHDALGVSPACPDRSSSQDQATATCGGASEQTPSRIRNAAESWYGPYHARMYSPWQQGPAQGQQQQQQHTPVAPHCPQPISNSSHSMSAPQLLQLNVGINDRINSGILRQYTPGLKHYTPGSSAPSSGRQGSKGRASQSPRWKSGLQRLGWDDEALISVLGSRRAAEEAIEQAERAEGRFLDGTGQDGGTLYQFGKLNSTDGEDFMSARASNVAEDPVDVAEDDLLSCSHGLSFASAYHEVCGQEPAFTTCHNRYIGTVDYLWYSKEAVQEAVQEAGEGHLRDKSSLDNLVDSNQQVHINRHVDESVGGLSALFHTSTAGGSLPCVAHKGIMELLPVRVLLPPDARALPHGLPNPGWPSDHVSLVCDFQFARKSESC
ncbi:hypothetical protein CEUSTIGMA_g924.t1 [Chlamydomonas eustigma]|uniref:C3H1-type domain-containing protein n=1 Tax=Chlamydomonas eustigma TaxID=1157962 RepID=A0A250WS25_9CHLO|nr:hypothetical protein CEUSTIGMA_g924.t1 [Chlamydomonas eustigma]|eukprot:GAX73472.1 hypothetical protein CEUSTIGMA_g924.t1 [Chlamydomonas eustigma]